MSTFSRFHHGDLKAALVRSALALIEEKGAEAVSLREVARHAGVSAAAPYRHYDGRDALLAAVAQLGFEQLYERLTSTGTEGEAQSTATSQCVAYVRFAQDHPALYRLMFGSVSGKHLHSGLVEASGRLFALLEDQMARAGQGYPSRAIGCWAFVHGLATLLLDGQLEPHRPGLLPNGLEAVIAPFVAALGW